MAFQPTDSSFVPNVYDDSASESSRRGRRDSSASQSRDFSRSRSRRGRHSESVMIEKSLPKLVYDQSTNDARIVAQMNACDRDESLKHIKNKRLPRQVAAAIDRIHESGNHRSFLPMSDPEKAATFMSISGVSGIVGISPLNTSRRLEILLFNVLINIVSEDDDGPVTNIEQAMDELGCDDGTLMDPELYQSELDLTDVTTEDDRSSMPSEGSETMFPLNNHGSPPSHASDDDSRMGMDADHGIVINSDDEDDQKLVMEEKTAGESSSNVIKEEFKIKGNQMMVDQAEEDELLSANTNPDFVSCLDDVKSKDQNCPSITELTVQGHSSMGSMALANRPSHRGFRNPQVLVLSPTKELLNAMDSKLKLFKKNGVVSLEWAIVTGGLSNVSQMRNQLFNRDCDLILATPGRLLDLMWANEFSKKLEELSFVFIDEFSFSKLHAPEQIDEFQSHLEDFHLKKEAKKEDDAAPDQNAQNENDSPVDDDQSLIEEKETVGELIEPPQLPIREPGHVEIISGISGDNNNHNNNGDNPVSNQEEKCDDLLDDDGEHRETKTKDHIFDSMSSQIGWVLVQLPDLPCWIQFGGSDAVRSGQDRNFFKLLKKVCNPINKKEIEKAVDNYVQTNFDRDSYNVIDYLIRNNIKRYSTSNNNNDARSISPRMRSPSGSIIRTDIDFGYYRQNFDRKADKLWDIHDFAFKLIRRSIYQELPREYNDDESGTGESSSNSSSPKRGRRRKRRKRVRQRTPSSGAEYQIGYDDEFGDFEHMDEDTGKLIMRLRPQNQRVVIYFNTIIELLAFTRLVHRNTDTANLADELKPTQNDDQSGNIANNSNSSGSNSSNSSSGGESVASSNISSASSDCSSIDLSDTTISDYKNDDINHEEDVDIPLRSQSAGSQSTSTLRHAKEPKYLSNIRWTTFYGDLGYQTRTLLLDEIVNRKVHLVLATQVLSMASDVKFDVVIEASPAWDSFEYVKRLSTVAKNGHFITLALGYKDEWREKAFINLPLFKNGQPPTSVHQFL